MHTTEFLTNHKQYHCPLATPQADVSLCNIASKMKINGNGFRASYN